MRFLDKNSIKRLFEIAAEDSPRNHAILLVGYWHGMRASEIVGTPGWRSLGKKKYWYEPLRGVDIRDGEIAVRRLKGSLKTTQPLRSHLNPLFDEKTILEKLAAETPGILFPIHRTTFWRFFQKYQEAAGIKQSEAHPHILKHSIAMHGKQAGIDIATVQTILGHKNINNTRIYWTISDEEAAQAFAQVTL